MAIWLQHLLVMLLVTACAAIVVGQLLRTFQFKKSKFGACCAKGCGGFDKPAPAQRVVFLPSDMLSITRRPGGK